MHGMLNNKKIDTPSIDEIINSTGFLKRYFQFGSTQNNQESISKYIDSLQITPNNDLFDIQKMKRDLMFFCRQSGKNLNDNYAKLKQFITNTDIDKVIILGHSFAGIDQPYYSHIIIPLLVKSKWTFYCYKDNDDGRKAEAFAINFAKNNYLTLSDNPFPRW